MNNVPDVIVVNGHGLGEYCNVKRIPVAGETCRAYNRHFEMDAGKGTNVACAIGRLGEKVAFIGKGGDDEGGRLGTVWMGESHVDLTHYLIDPNVVTNLGLCIIAENGENMLLDFDDDKNAMTLEETDEHIRQCIGARFMTTGFGVPVKTALYAVTLAKRLGMFTLMNASPLQDDVVLPKMPDLDVLVVNETEAALLLGLPKDSGQPPPELAKMLREKYECQNVIITLGAQGSAAASKDEEWSIEPTIVDMVDETGAGDGYLAAVTVCLLWGRSLYEAMQWASVYSAYLVTLPGSLACYPTIDKIAGIFKSLGQQELLINKNNLEEQHG